MENETWRALEQKGVACRRTLDAEGMARAYYEAAINDTYLRSQREHYSAYLFALHYLPGLAPEAIAEQHRVYGKLYEAYDVFQMNEKHHTPLRVGFLAPHFCEGSAARFYEALLSLPRDRFATFAYSVSDEADAFTAQVRRAVGVYRLLPRDLAAAEDILAADDLDVLVDLGGHTEGGATLMLLANHPARRIIEAVGWFDTTGLPAVDELLTDEVMDPAGREALLTERPLYLPHAWCFTPSKEMRAVRERLAGVREKCLADEAQRSGAVAAVPPSASALAQAHDPVIYIAGFQNFLKVKDEVLRAWKVILERVPQAQLLLRDTMRSAERVDALAARFAALDWPRNRVTIAMGSNDYLMDLADQDIVLDTWPYPGGAMTATALYLGVPVLTMRGDSHSRSVGASVLMAAGLPELIAEDTEDYIEKAVTLATHPAKLAALREKVWNCVLKSPLFDRESYIGAWMNALQT